MCDVCVSKGKNVVCCVCSGVGGLMKRTFEGEYGHPVCLLFCRDSLVVSYKLMNFHFLRSKRKYKN